MKKKKTILEHIEGKNDLFLKEGKIWMMIIKRNQEHARWRKRKQKERMKEKEENEV